MEANFSVVTRDHDRQAREIAETISGHLTEAFEVLDSHPKGSEEYCTELEKLNFHFIHVVWWENGTPEILVLNSTYDWRVEIRRVGDDFVLHVYRYKGHGVASGTGISRMGRYILH